MKLNYLFLCENAFLSEGNKLNIIGIFQNINIKKFPGGLPKFHLAGGFSIPNNIEKLKLQAELFGPKGKKIDIKLSQQGEFPKRKAGTEISLNFNFAVNNFLFKKAGKYKFIVSANNKKAGETSFNVTELNKEK